MESSRSQLSDGIFFMNFRYRGEECHASEECSVCLTVNYKLAVPPKRD